MTLVGDDRSEGRAARGKENPRDAYATGRSWLDPRLKSEAAPDESRLCWRATGSIREYQSDQPSLLAASTPAPVDPRS